MNFKALSILELLIVLGCTSNKIDSPTRDRTFLDTSITNSSVSIRLMAISNTDTTAILKQIVDEQEVIIDTLDQPTAIGYIEVIDFNRDGTSDILLDYIGNNPTYHLYLYDTNTLTFKNVDNYSSFPEAQQLKSNRELYYSYHAAGCADMSWVSDLFTIKDFKITHFAHLFAKGCAGEKQGISVFKVIANRSDNTILIDTIEYSGEQNETKGEIIRNYWEDNSIKFLQ